MQRKAVPLWALAVAVLVLVAGACGSGAAGKASAATTVQLIDYRIVPASITVPLNSTLTIKNAGSTEHSFVLAGQNVGTEIAAGKTRPLHLTGVPAGTYHVYCEESGHVDRGMVGTLTITP